MKTLKVRSSRVILLAVLLAGLWMPAQDSAPSASAHSKSSTVESVLNPDGSLGAGVAGSFDVSGYRMELTATGAPRFVPAQAGCGTADWDAQFGLANGTNDAVRALAVMGNAIYVGGDFTPARHVAA